METFQSIFKNQAKIHGDKVAVSYREESLTYKQLDEKSTRLAAYLNKNGINKGIIPIVTERSADMLVGILGIVKSGACYLPVDYNFPQSRIKYMLEDSMAEVLLISKKLSKEVDVPCTMKKIIYNDDYESPENQSLNENYSVNDPMYLIYTSGTTNRPKGVLISQKSVLNLIRSMKTILNLKNSLVMLSLTTISFDIFVFESLLPLALGMEIVISDPMDFYNQLCSKNIDILQTTPTTMRLILEDKRNESVIRNLKYMLLGGEKFPNDLLESLKRLTKSRIYNVYGPTETTVWSTIKELTNQSEITIGKPIMNTEVIIMKDGVEVTGGCEGELCIAGDGLALGYWNDLEKTKEKFVMIKHNGKTIKVYKTGDLAKYNENNEIVYIGRNDKQVKVRGFRMELDEINCAVQKIPQISFSFATVSKLAGDDVLECYYVSDQKLDYKDIFLFLKKLLPYYMIPQAFYRLKSIPLLPNGKLDINNIKKAKMSVSDDDSSYKSEIGSNTQFDDVTNNIISIWSEILNLNSLKNSDSFFELGGTSVLLVRMCNAVSKLYPFVTVGDAFSYPTVEKLSGFINNEIKRRKVQ